MDKRLGFVGIIVEDRRKAAARLNAILSEHGDIMVGRMGMPYSRKKCSVIALIVDATTDQVGELTGKLGMIEGVSVRSALGKKP